MLIDNIYMQVPCGIQDWQGKHDSCYEFSESGSNIFNYSSIIPVLQVRKDNKC